MSLALQSPDNRIEGRHTSTASFTRRFGWLYLGVCLVVFFPVLFNPASQIFGWSGDSQQTMWFLGWFWHAIVRGENPFVSNMLNYPYGFNLMVNTSIPADAALFGPLEYLVNGAFAYNALLFTNLVVSGWLGGLILREFGVRWWLAGIGGIAFQLLPYTTAQGQAHAQLAVTAWLLAAFYLTLRVLRAKPRHAVLIGVSVGVLLAGEFYTSVEVTATCAFVVTIGFALAGLLARQSTRELLRRIPLRFVAAALISCIILVGPGLYEFVFGPNVPKGGIIPITYAAVIVSNDLLGFFIPTPLYALHSAWTTAITSHVVINYSEQDGYIGVVGLILLVWAARRGWIRPFVRVAMPLLVLIAVFSLGAILHVNGHRTPVFLPWAFVAQIPLIGQALPARLMFYGDVLTVLVVFIALEEALRSRADDSLSLLNKRTPKRSTIAVAATALLLLASWAPAVAIHSATPPSWQALQPGSPIVARIGSAPTLILSNDVEDVLQSLADGGYRFPVANGYVYTANNPTENHVRPYDLAAFQNMSQTATMNYVRNIFHATHVSWVLFVPVSPGTVLPPTLATVLTELCGHPVIDRSVGVYVWSVPRALH
ncbi:hypothetical protein [Alicyclobacillus sp. ALC3]|uniref:hypothetical protein n=1 Tax=Alicyclobacillus sp. ALC3 TaxID=2796143 RepID=UPI0023791435|nr:hypothetical protein [Alicyclobacillus sp. ALC3]WDL95377.1 hypothetical protein JC200_13250 [Alicyclobacillus sp. ALC3]